MAAKLATIVKRKTVSASLDSPAPPAELDSLHADLASAFPKVTAALTREVIGEHSLLYTWKGSDAARAPIILCAHIDVVPVEPGTTSAWTHPAFDGVIEGGFVCGRGTIDDKGSLIAILSAVEALLGERFAPARTVYLAFVQDEEISGLRYYGKVAEDVYRFAPFRFTAADIQRVHGKDERLAVASLADGVRFYRRLVQQAAGP